jgi:hypothetical protein
MGSQLTSSSHWIYRQINLAGRANRVGAKGWAEIGIHIGPFRPILRRPALVSGTFSVWPLERLNTRAYGLRKSKAQT